jgi:hypothetical protein
MPIWTWIWRSAGPSRSTHDIHGGGHPRLIFTFGGRTQLNSKQREFNLLPGVTTIGSNSGADLCSGGSRVNGQPVGERSLHTGDRIELGGCPGEYF